MSSRFRLINNLNIIDIGEMLFLMTGHGDELMTFDKKHLILIEPWRPQLEFTIG